MHGKPRSIANPKDIRRMLIDEAPRLADLLRRCGKRVRYAFNNARENTLPGEDVLEWAKFYQRGIVEVARAVAEANNARNGQPALSEDEYREELRFIAMEHLRTMPAEALAKLITDAGIAGQVSIDRTGSEGWA